jgi:hypothetical protein
VPEFVDVEIGGKVRTAIKLIVTPRGEDTKPPEKAPQDEAPQEEMLETAD